jgi:phosphoribosylglycinamide formyltransferase 1
MTARRKSGILISGRGSNMAALIDACKAADFPAEISVVISNRADAPGLERARSDGIATAVVDHRQFDDRPAFEEQLDRTLRDHGVEIVCNAGFMRLLTEFFVQKWYNRQINIHPSLLPAYTGLHTHERILQDGVRITGCTVHFVRTEMDAGPIIAQAAVPVLTNDTPDTLADRVLAAEHAVYPLALRLVAEGRARVVGDKVVLDCDDLATGPLYSPQITQICAVPAGSQS